MVLDSFMNGFIHRLYNEKWKKYKFIFIARRTFDIVLVSAMATRSFILKDVPLEADSYTCVSSTGI